MPSTLANFLYRYAGEYQPYRYAENASLLHVSDLYDLCFRQVYFLDQRKAQHGNYIPSRLQMRFEMGKAMELAVKKILIAGGISDGEEVRIVNEELGLVGRADCRQTNGKLTEIKAKDPAVFRLTRRTPLRKDQFQLETYLWMDQTKRGDLLMLTWGDEKNPFRSHEVSYNVKVGELVKRRMGELRNAQAGGAIPDRICAGPHDTRSALCPVRDLCFAHGGNMAKTIKESL